ncbi:hypothetical protein JTE90_023472 [Oedothorax gibbosus]|uniref:Uncharacterized protein n=1 Tax=Oedothorax gibbosus TaxID=931172 RepID=A0AAV6VQB8_9ARAC|nr:hypothetical protein JTE90_023472 [Oedothorax gibbosus]
MCKLFYHILESQTRSETIQQLPTSKTKKIITPQPLSSNLTSESNDKDNYIQHRNDPPIHRRSCVGCLHSSSDFVSRRVPTL